MLLRRQAVWIDARPNGERVPSFPTHDAHQHLPSVFLTHFEIGMRMRSRQELPCEHSRRHSPRSGHWSVVARKTLGVL